jgi:hypothetical protein
MGMAVGASTAAQRPPTHDHDAIHGEREGPLVARAIARAKAGDLEAIGFLYARYAENVNGYVRSILHDPHEAEDVTQQVFAKLIT